MKSSWPSARTSLYQLLRMYCVMLYAMLPQWRPRHAQSFQLRLASRKQKKVIQKHLEVAVRVTVVFKITSTIWTPIGFF